MKERMGSMITNHSSPSNQNRMVKLSIIVPVYKVEQYIEKCIASILTSKYFDSDCELIVVDDGSPDKSIDIVRDSVTHVPTLLFIGNTMEARCCTECRRAKPRTATICGLLIATIGSPRGRLS